MRSAKILFRPFFKANNTKTIPRLPNAPPGQAGIIKASTDYADWLGLKKNSTRVTIHSPVSDLYQNPNFTKHMRVKIGTKLMVSQKVRKQIFAYTIV